MKRPKKSSTVAVVVIVVAELILLNLGVWQLQRLEWKQGIIADIDAALAAPTTLFQSEDFSKMIYGSRYQRIQYKTKLDDNRRYFLRPRTYKGQAGGHLVYAIDNLIINFGWLTEEMYDALPNRIFGERQIVIQGLLSDLDKKGAFVPENDPESNRLYWLDHQQLATLPYVLRVNPLPKALSAYDVTPLPLKPQLRNKHAQYAGFWFGMAGLLLILVLVALKQKSTS